MISYQWDVQETVVKMVNALEAVGLSVWVDYNWMHLYPGTMEAMAKAVEGAKVCSDD